MKSFAPTSTMSNISSKDIVGHSQKIPFLKGISPGNIAIPESETDYWSPALNQLLEEPPATFPQRITIGAIAFCLTVGTWAWYGEIDEVGKAQGKLIPQGETYKIESVELGKVKYIAVKEGEEVQAGQTLIELDTDLAEQEIARLEQMIRASQTELNQKILLRKQLTLEAKTREDITKAEVSAKRSGIFIAKRKAVTFRHLLNQQQLEVKAHLAKQANLKSLSTLGQERLRQLKAEKISRQQRLERLLPLAQQGAISQEHIFQAEQSLREVERLITQSQLQEIANIREQNFQSNLARRELEARMTHNQGELASALIELERLEAELTQTQAEGKRIQLETEQKIKQLEFEITRIQNEIADTKNLLSTAQVKLEQKFLKAPVDGIVLSLNIDNSGKVVQPGETIIEIAPEDAPLVVSAFLPNKEAGLIKEGMSVQVKLDAYPYQSYGLIPGTLNSVSADAKLNPQLGEVYQVEVALERDYVTDNQRKIKFKAGQTATADIVIRRRRILDVWLEPIKKLQHNGIKM
ncbi:MAG: HlyD family efflux transporter periplasmic adaptor subunit [Xenococcaceae cyanobacterium MO_188.B19]|nr:HlyD family efflux transporter periplasmic adaptor subunit [Xenococcaceae cyanobacterium MO_188.B19]